MMWCTLGLLVSLTAQDPQPQQAQTPGFEIVDLKPAGKSKKTDSASQRRVSTKPTGKPLEIKMPKQKKGSTKFQKPKKR